MSTTEITPAEVEFTPAEDGDVTFTPEAEEPEPTTLCECQALVIKPHIFVEGLCELAEDEDTEDA